MLPPRFPVRFAVFSLGRGSTASMGLSTDCLGIAPLASPISNPLLDGRSPLQRNPKTLFVNIFPGGEYQIQTGVRPCQKSFGNFDYILILQYILYSIIINQIFVILPHCCKQMLFSKFAIERYRSLFKVSEPTYFVTYDIGFKRETYFDGSFGVLRKVENLNILKILV